MRPAPFIAGLAMLAWAACTPFPDIEDRLSDVSGYPRLQRLDALTGTVPADERLSGTEAGELQSRGDALRGRGTAVSGSTGPDAETLERLRAAREAYDDAAADGGLQGGGGDTGAGRVRIGDAGAVLEGGGGGGAGDSDAETLARVERLRSGSGTVSDAAELLQRAEAAAAAVGETLSAEERRLLLLRARTRADEAGQTAAD